MSDRRLAAILVLLGFLIRYVVYLGSFLFSSDGSQILRMVDWFHAGRFGEALSVGYHPLFPMLASLLKPLVGSERAAMGISMVLGSAAAAPLFLTVRDAVGRPAAFLGALFYAFHPQLVELQADVMTEGTFCFFLFTAIWLGWETTKDPRWETAILAGVASAAAYLTRPEGLIVLAGVPCWLIVSIWRGRWRARLATVALAALASVIVSYPFLLYTRGVVGHWAVSPKSSVLHTLEGEQRPDLKMIERGEIKERAPYAEIVGHVLRVTYGIFLPIVGVGFVAMRRNWASLFCLSFPILYWAAVVLAAERHPWTSYRYFLPGMALFLPIAAAGIVRILGWFKRPQWLPAVSLLLVFLMAMRAVRVSRLEERAIREAAAWITERGHPAPVVASSSDKLNYLTGSAPCGLPLTWEEFVRDSVRYEFVACLQSDIEKGRVRYSERIPERFAEVRSFESADGSKVYVYSRR